MTGAAAELGPDDKVVQISCDTTASAALTGAAGSTVQIDGEFCGVPAGTAEGALTVLFLIDRSDSMDSTDPVSGESCERLNAARALIDRLKDTAATGTTVTAGVQGFGDAAFPPVAPKALEEFEADLTTDTFCDTKGGATNYEAALAGALKLLHGRKGPKAIYLISDGLPTVSGLTKAPLGSVLATGAQYLAKVQAAGLAAAKLLRAVPNLVVNALYFGTDAESVVAGNLLPEPYLALITGSKKRVRLAADAGALATNILSLEPPDAVSLAKEGAKGTLVAEGFPELAVELATLAKDPARPGVWRFTTDPIPLFGTAGMTTTNDLQITITTSDGKAHGAKARVALTVPKG